MPRSPFPLPSSWVPYWPNLAEVGECRSLLGASMPGSFLRAREGVWRGRGKYLARGPKWESEALCGLCIYRQLFAARIPKGLDL